MKSDFITIKQQLPGIIRVVSDFYQTPRKKGSVFFVKSPATHDRVASLALYPSSNRFCDFANGNLSGDCIAFVAYVRGCNNWEALQILKDFYGLTDSREQEKEEIRQRIKLQQEQDRKKTEQRQAFKEALIACVDNLKHWSSIYRAILEKRLYEPFSEEWQHCIEELQRAEYQLDVLCGVSYRRRDSKEYSKWLLDSLAILKEKYMLELTKKEVEEIGRGGVRW